MPPDAFLLGAKFDREDPDGRYHPLICHMLDVAWVARATWEQGIAAESRRRIAEALQLNEAAAGSWVAFLAGAHDLGKASIPFQAKDPHAPDRLAGTPLSFAGRATDPGHGFVTSVHLPDILVHRFNLERRLAGTLSLITGGHHGIFPDREGREARGEAIQERRPEVREAWEEARTLLVVQLSQLLGVRGVPAGRPQHAVSMLLAGLISVADWIGSNDDDEAFPFDPRAIHDLERYGEHARTRAEVSLDRMYWTATSRPGKPGSFGSLFAGIGDNLRPLQRTTESIASRADSPGLVIVEAPMGEGKTEAAFFLADRWNVAGARGAYIALPTQATANQMYRRFARFLEDRFPNEPVNLQLAHGGRTGHIAQERLPTHVDGDTPEGAVGAAEWFVKRKRTLLAPYGVGTIDQALMAVLQVRHGFVRLYGLASKTVVIDEVHAYDAYMTTLLERLLEWLAALGSPVVLLSATLPGRTRQRLMHAYLHGRGADAETTSAVDTSGPYPRLTWTEGGTIASRSFAAWSARVLNISPIGSSLADLSRHLQDRLAGGGCAAVVCNTVRRAQEVYRALRNDFAPGTELDLLHARFVIGDRSDREAQVLGQFGPPANNANRPRRFVLIATQIIEQSLDLDFDLMVRDLAPLDLLLQRSGRLHRHQGRERFGHTDPELLIRQPDTNEDATPRFDGGSRAVYHEHILLRTWWLLRDRSAIAIPGDVQALIDTVYSDEPGVPADAPEELREVWQQTWAKMQQDLAQEEREGKDRIIGRPSMPGSLTQLTGTAREEESPELHPRHQALTRLTEPSVDVVLIDAEYGTALQQDGPALLREDADALLDRAVSVSDRRVLHELLGQDPPPRFAKSPLLRRHRLVVLDKEGAAEFGNAMLRYDGEVGLEVLEANPSGP